MTDDSRPRFPSFWQVQVLGWVSFYTVSMAGSIPRLLSRPAQIIDSTVNFTILFLGSCVLRLACRALLRRSQAWLAFELRAAAWSLAMGAVCALLTGLILLGPAKMNWASQLGNSVQFGFVCFMWCSLYFSIKQWQRSAQERERLLQAETEARDARLRALRYQLNPHFLFNSLNAVSTLILDGEATAANRMLGQIADLLRTSLDDQTLPEVALSRELAFTQQYIAIEQTRLGDRLQIEMSIAPETLDALVPSMLLQPLLENAVRHGIAPLVEGGAIGIESAAHGDRLRLVVRNSGRRVTDGLAGGRSGIGQSNIEERLKTLYGTNHRFTLAWPEAGGCEATVELPFRTGAS